MVMQVFRGGEDGDNIPVNPSSSGGGGAKAAIQSGGRWFFDAAPQTRAQNDDRQTASVPSAHFLKFAARKPAIDFSEPRPA